MTLQFLEGEHPFPDLPKGTQLPNGIYERLSSLFYYAQEKAAQIAVCYDQQRAKSYEYETHEWAKFSKMVESDLCLLEKVQDFLSGFPTPIGKTDKFHEAVSFLHYLYHPKVGFCRISVFETPDAARSYLTDFILPPTQQDVQRSYLTDAILLN